MTITHYLTLKYLINRNEKERGRTIEKNKSNVCKANSKLKEQMRKAKREKSARKS